MSERVPSTHAYWQRRDRERRARHEQGGGMMAEVTEKVPGVYKKIAKVMAEVERIPKRGRNDFHNYDYATEADLLDHIRPAMAKAGLVMVPEQGFERDEVEVKTKTGSTMVTRILHTFQFIDVDDGSVATVTVWGEGQDSLDKASYKAFTGAVKYALMKTFLVATGDDPEADQVAGEGRASKPRKTRAAPAKKPAAKPTGEPPSEKQIDYLRKLITSHHFTAQEVTKVQRRIADGLDKDATSKAIDWALECIQQREASELDESQPELEGVAS